MAGDPRRKDVRDRVKRLIFGCISAAIGIALAIAAIEGMAILWLMVEDGHYTPTAELFERTQNTYVRDLTRGSACRYVDTLYPHPYVGFVHHGNPPCGIPNVNNVGLFNDDFPAIKRTDRWTILLTGGSVAAQLAQYDPPPAPRFLEDELNNEYVSPNGKPFLVLNGGDGAWKQPQPFILFALHAQAVDAVITLSGMNEYYLFRHYERARLEWPLGNFVDVNPLVAEANFGNAAIGWVLARIAGELSRNPVLGRSHAVYLMVRAIEAAAKGTSAWDSSKRTTVDRMFALPPGIAGEAEPVFAIQLALFQKYNRAIEAMARDNGVKTAYFFQPVPAFGKTLTPQEKAVAGDLSYIVLYRRIVGAMLLQRSLGMAVFDLGDLFVDVKETIYADSVHFYRAPDGESRGYRLMAKRVAAELAAAWGLKPKHDGLGIKLRNWQ
jgi:hypothetical protein